MERWCLATQKPFLPGIHYSFLQFNGILKAPLLIQYWISPYTVTKGTAYTDNKHGERCPLLLPGTGASQYTASEFRGTGMRLGASKHLLPCSQARYVEPSWAHHPAPGQTHSAWHGLSLLILWHRSLAELPCILVRNLRGADNSH